MKRFLPALICFAVFIALGFTLEPGTTPTEVKTGKYGVCGGDTANPTIELFLRKDSTFRYYNMSYPAGTVDVDGKWKVEKGAVILYDYKKGVAIHNKWKIEDGNCLKALKASGGIGLLMFRICHLETCGG